jgi:hypothetical protein
MPDMPPGNTWYFNLVTDPNPFPFKRTSDPADPANDVFIHPSYTGADQEAFDLALIDVVPEPCNQQCLSNLDSRLQSATRYDVFRGTNELGMVADIVGYGLGGEGIEGGDDMFGEGVKRNGKNKIEITTDELNGLEMGSINAQPPDSQLAVDFDAYDPVSMGELTECRTPPPPPDAPTCDAFGHYLGLNDLGLNNLAPNFEVGVSNGDSGGPWFLGGKIAGVGSFVYFHLDTDIEEGGQPFGSFGEVASAMRVSWQGVAHTDCITDGHLDWIDCTVDIIAPRVTEI